MTDEPTTYLSHHSVPLAPSGTGTYQPPGGYSEPTSYLQQAPAQAPRKRMSPVLAGVVGLAVGAILGGGGVLLTHTSSSSAPAGQMGNFNGGPGGGMGGVRPSGAPNGVAP
ncbi:MAG TPA: hypothetical protein VJT31_03200, partial [Rugosimonospora sp.]|nr:hypothetical protein [Rugosimonospora sp.]